MVTSSQVEGFVRSTGCLSSYAWRVVLSRQLHRGWVVASGRQVMYWALRRKRPLHSSAYRLILQWGRALRFDTAQAEGVYRSSGHAISHPPIVRQVCCKCSCPGGPVCRKRRSQSFLWPFALKCLST